MYHKFRAHRTFLWVAQRVGVNKRPVTVSTLNNTDLVINNTPSIFGAHQQKITQTTGFLDNVFLEQYSHVQRRPIKRRGAPKFRILSLFTILTLTNCDIGPAGPQGLAGTNGKDIQIVDSIRINSKNKLKIPANKQWISSNVYVSMGDKILMKASGGITINSEVIDPNGSSAVGGLGFSLPNRPVYSLYFKIGTSDVTKAGRSYFGFAADSGEIKFLINTVNELSDSAGYFTIDSLVTYSENDFLLKN